MADPSSSETIDNLKPDWNIRYAESEAIKDFASYNESSKITSSARRDTLEPIAHDHFVKLFDTHRRNMPWAALVKPQGFEEQQKRIFTYQVVPSVGSEEKLENGSKRIDDTLKKMLSPILSQISSSESQSEFETAITQNDHSQLNQLMEQASSQDKAQLEKPLQEAFTIKTMIDKLLDLDKIMSDIEKKRNQYQKG